MMQSSAPLPDGTTFDVEVCVVGSGAGGAVVASRLAQDGVHVLLIEEGDHHAAATMSQDEHEMIPRLYQEAGQRMNSDQSIMIMQGRALGGGTTHNTGLCMPIAEATWESWRAGVPDLESFAALRPRLDRVMTTLRARPARDDEVNTNNSLLRSGAEKLGLRHSLAHHNRLECSGCGYCSLGCAYNRKLSVVHAFLPDGIAAGLGVVTGLQATRIAPSPGGFHVGAIGKSGKVVINTRVLILAAGAVHTPLLLRRWGLARRKRVGDDLRLHPFAPVGALFDDDVLAWRGVPQTVIIDDRAHFHSGGDAGYLLMVAAAQPAVTAVMSQGHGALHRRVMTSYRRLAAAGVLVHDSSRGAVRARADGKPLIRYWPNAGDQRQFREGLALLARLYFEVGAREVLLPFAELPAITSRGDIARIATTPFRRHSVTLGSVHPQGTCPMSRDGRTGAVDGFGRVHGEPRLFVCDTSIFPTSLGVPPQVTTMAFGLLQAEWIAAHRSELFA